jgi:serine/threonine-protein kinase
MGARDVPLLAPGSDVAGHRVVEHLGLRGMSDRYRLQADNGEERLLGLITAHHADLPSRLRSLPVLRLRHPNLLGLEQVLEIGRLPALLSEPVQGTTLTAWLADRSGPDPTSALVLFRAIAEGLAAGHALGQIHRDLRPENVLVEGDVIPHARVMDLGVASALFDLVIGGKSITSSGTTIGEPRYWSPERARKPQSADARSDLFSLGCILYELFAGVGPFDGLNLYECYHATLDGRFVPLERRSMDAPVEVVTLVKRLLAPRPEHRPASCEEALAMLLPPDAALPPPKPATPVSPPTPKPPIPQAPRAKLSPMAIYAAIAVGAAAVSAMTVAAGWILLR